MARRSLRIQEQLTTAKALISDVLEPPATRKRAKVTKTENDSKPPESRKRTRKNLPKKTVEDEEDEYSDDMAPATKRRRVPEEYRKVRGRFGLLQKLVQDVPLEVILEIFCFLEPGDLLRLSRTSKELRGILMSRSTQDVWRSARENVQDLPPLPPDLNEPQYARLLEDAYCYTCKHKGRCETILWTFRARVCKGCLEGQVYDHEYLHQQPHQYRNLLPSEELLLKHSFVRFASNKITAQYRREFEALQTEEERQAWIELKKVQKPAIEKHAHLCRMWHMHKMGDRDRAIARIRRDRKSAQVFSFFLADWLNNSSSPAVFWTNWKKSAGAKKRTSWTRNGVDIGIEQATSFETTNLSISLGNSPTKLGRLTRPTWWKF
ncbi:hypothetical protein D9757_013041 [Collybiopsis confluens]|uniref:F-box domain-containing protein n=1 Tax=Collybiopsis confluens TaxID=2823264 RepID=A0A8H5LPP3_9AGAR|nr:hypothetical protein D9757_013041 [Collybiopsis confluens]